MDPMSVTADFGHFWRCGLCGASVPMGTPHECEQGSAFMPPSAVDRIAVALERIADALEG